MRTFIISYDLKQLPTSVDYNSFFEQLMSFSDFTPLTDHSWLIKYEGSSLEVFDKLVGHIFSLDPLFVIAIDGDAEWLNLKSHDEKLYNILPYDDQEILPEQEVPVTLIESLKQKWNGH